MAIHKNTSITILLLRDDYLKISLYTHLPNLFMDMYFHIDDTPDYVLKLLNHMKCNSFTTYTENGGCIVTGLCLVTGKLSKMKYIYINEYEKMLKTEQEFIYDKDLSFMLANEHLKYITDQCVF